jgi:hypothetical protein
MEEAKVDHVSTRKIAWSNAGVTKTGLMYEICWQLFVGGDVPEFPENTQLRHVQNRSLLLGSAAASPQAERFLV